MRGMGGGESRGARRDERGWNGGWTPDISLLSSPSFSALDQIRSARNAPRTFYNDPLCCWSASMALAALWTRSKRYIV